MSIEITPKRGVAMNYGARNTDAKYGGMVMDRGDVVKKVSFTFDYNDLPSYGSDNLELAIPANASIKAAYLEIIAAFTSTSTTTDLHIGLYTSAGVAISATGLFDGTDATQTTIATAGNIIDGVGALVGTTIGATAGEVVVAPTVDDLLTGRARLVVEYIPQGV